MLSPYSVPSPAAVINEISRTSTSLNSNDEPFLLDTEDTYPSSYDFTNQNTNSVSIPAKMVLNFSDANRLSRKSEKGSPFDAVATFSSTRPEQLGLHQQSHMSSFISQELSLSQEIMPERLLSKHSAQKVANSSRPSSRKALTKALELAREAVRLDSTNNDPYGAIIAYGKSVSLLSEVMERVLRGDDGPENCQKRHGGRRRSIVDQEEEVRRLKSIVSL